MSMDFDLLGDPIPEGWGRRGRPPHMATDEKRRIVSTLLAFDWSLEKVAAALNCTPPTLRKYYFRELKFREEQRARVEAKLVGALMAEVEKGNVAAIGKMFERFEKHDRQRLTEVYQATKQSKPEKLGKKEQAKAAAGQVGGRFAPPQGPGRLVN